MSKIFWYGLGLPFIAVAMVMSYIMWNIFSTGEWKYKKPGLRLDWLHQGEIASLHQQMRVMAHSHQSEIDELQRKHQNELKQLQRKHSFS